MESSSKRTKHIDVRYFYVTDRPIVPSSHGSDDKKYVATGRRITDAREEQKRSRCFVRTLLIKDFKYGSSLSLLTEKIMTINGRKVSQF